MKRTCDRCGMALLDEAGNNRAVGVEATREYRGILFWFCPDCGWTWQRREPGDPFYDVAQAHIDRLNAGEPPPPPTRRRRSGTQSSTASGAVDEEKKGK